MEQGAITRFGRVRRKEFFRCYGKKEITRARIRRRKKRNLLPYLLLLPVVVFITVFTIIPFIQNIYLSFYVTDSLGNPGSFVGLKNYIRIFTSEAFGNSLYATLRFSVTVAVGTFLVSMITALLCATAKGGKVFQIMFALPMAVASAPLSAIANYMLSNYGVLNKVLGTEIGWLTDEKIAVFVVAGVTIWSSMGASFIFLMAGFKNVPADLVEEAKIDGAGALRRVLYIYIPIASPQIFFVIFLNILSALKQFGIIKFLAGSGPNDSTNILVYALYSNAMYRGRFETACVYAIVLSVIIFVVTRIQLLCEKRMVHYQ